MPTLIRNDGMCVHQSNAYFGQLPSAKTTHTIRLSLSRKPVHRRLFGLFSEAYIVLSPEREMVTEGDGEVKRLCLAINNSAIDIKVTDTGYVDTGIYIG